MGSIGRLLDPSLLKYITSSKHLRLDFLGKDIKIYFVYRQMRLDDSTLDTRTLEYYM